MRERIICGPLIVILTLLSGSVWSASHVDGILKLPLVDVQEFASLSEAVDSPATAGKTILIGREIDCGDLRISGDRSIKILRGGSINVAANRTLSIDGPFEAGEYHVFTGTGVVSFGEKVKEISPYWFGVTGDGVTDDTAAFNRCIAAGTLHTIRIPKGTYMISGPDGLHVTKRTSNIKFVLDPATVLRQVPNGFNTPFAIFHLDGTDNITITGGILQGDRKSHDYSLPGTHEFGYGICINKSTNIVINGVKITQCTGDSAIIYGVNTSGTYLPSKNIKILNCDLSSARRNNISIVVGHDILIEGNFITDAGINDGIHGGTAPQMGIDIEGGSCPSKVIISNNIFKGNLAGSVWSFNGNYVDIIGNIADTGMGFQNSSNVNIVNNVIADMNNTNGTAIVKSTDVAKPLNAKTMLSIGSKYQIVSQKTIDFKTIGSSDNNVGTWFTATGVGPLSYGDSVLRANENIIINNNLLKGFGVGIDISKGTSNILINGNSLVEQATVGIKSASDDVDIVNNKLTKQAIGVRLNDGMNVSIRSNSISKVSNRAIFVSLGNDIVALISDNIINEFNNKINPAIDISSGKSLSINNNLLELGNVNGIGYGIVNGVVGSVISGNVIQNSTIANAAIATISTATISGNKILNVDAPKGIVVKSKNASGSLVSGNLLQLNTTRKGTDGIHVTDCSNTKVINNEINSTSAIFIDAVNTEKALSSQIIRNISSAGVFRFSKTDRIVDNVKY